MPRRHRDAPEVTGNRSEQVDDLLVAVLGSFADEHATH